MPTLSYKKTYNSRTIRGKLRVCRYLEASPRTRGYVPITASLSRSRLQEMLSSLSAVYVKPNIGSQGVGVYKAIKREDGYELFTTKRRKQIRKHFDSFDKLYKHLKAAGYPKMIVQKAVELDRVGDRPYDIRSMVQRKPGGSWTCTGFLVKVGAADKIVTNYHQGGQIWTIEKLLERKDVPEAQRKSRIRALKDASLDVARVLSARKSRMHEMGIDFAYDREQRLWVLEVNSNHPQFHPLKKIKRSDYNRMVRYARSYGRLDD